MKPLATMKYSEPSVRPFSSVMKNSRSLSAIAQIANTAIGPPIAIHGNQRRSRPGRRAAPTVAGIAMPAGAASVAFMPFAIRPPCSPSASAPSAIGGSL